MTAARIVFINRFYAPEEPATAQLLTDLAETLAAEGRRVVVITSAPRGRNLPKTEVRNGVEVRRVGGTKLGNRNILFQACDFATYAARSLALLAADLRPNDTVVVLTDPPLFAVPVVAVARQRGARVIHWLQDIYPEAAALLTGRRMFNWLRPVRNWAWRHADACVVLGEDMAALPKAAGVPAARLHLVPNWAPAGIACVAANEAEKLRGEWGLSGKFVVLYFGNLGRVHDLDPVLDIADRLRDQPGVQFVFVGPGAQRAPLETAAHRRNLQNVSFHPAQPRERRTEILGLGDVHLVTLREGGERVVYPSKMYSITAAGRPILFIGPKHSEISRTIVNHGLGLAFSRTDTAAIADCLRALRDDPQRLAAMGAAARDFYAREASIRQAAGRWTAVLATVETATGGRTP